MYKELIVKKEKIKEFYGAEIIPVLGSYLKFREALNPSFVNSKEELKLQDGGRFPYKSSFKDYRVLSGLPPEWINNDNYIMLPKNIVEEIEKPSLIDIFTPILDKMLPGHWCLIPKNKDEDRSYDTVCLHYPVINITNTKEDHYTVKDIIVSFHVYDNQIDKELYGWKYTFTKEELQVDDDNQGIFTHPHLDTYVENEDGEYREPNVFCLGGNSSLSQFLNKNYNDWNEIKFEAFLYQLKDYLEWESIEGGPYMRIGEFGLNKPLKNIDFNPSEVVEHSKTLLKQLTPDMISDVGVFEPEFNPKKLYEIELELVKTLPDNFLADYHETSKQFVQIDTPNLEDKYIPEGDWLIQEVAQKLNLKDTIEEAPERKKLDTIKRIHPQVFKTMVEQINKLLQMHTLA